MSHNKFEELNKNIERQLGEFFGEFELRFETLRQQFDASNTSISNFEDSTAQESPKHEEPEPSMESDWDRRKREILKEHGFLAEEETEDSGGDSVDEEGDQREPPRAGIEEEDENLHALQDSIQSLEHIGDEEIEALKAELTAKIRDAEVELSINRAKLSQQWAALEQKQFEVKQREAALHDKYGDIQPSKKKRRLIDRLSRHLSNKSSDYSDDEAT